MNRQISALIPALSPDLIERYKRDAAELERYESDVSSDAAVVPLDVLRAHYVVVDFCLSEDVAEPVGGIGPKDVKLLLSAIDRQNVEFSGKAKWENSFEKIATLVFGLVKNHPFYDANKRTALLSLVYAFYLNGRYITADKNELEDMLVYLADNSLHLIDGYDEFQGSDDKDIRFMAEYFRKNSRDIDNRVYTITYRELDRKLGSFGYSLGDPDRNYIDIIRRSDGRRVLKAGFPGWSRQVARGDMRRILDACDLTSNEGIDAQVFFHDEDPVFAFASEYRAQIKSLASR